MGKLSVVVVVLVQQGVEGCDVLRALRCIWLFFFLYKYLMSNILKGVQNSQGAFEHHFDRRLGV